MIKSNDLFEESAMSFGDHLEILRVHLIRSIIGLVICTGFTLFYGQDLVDYISQPIKRALVDHYGYAMDDLSLGGDSETEEKDQLSEGTTADGPTTDIATVDDVDNTVESNEQTPEVEKVKETDVLRVEVPVKDLVVALHEVDPESFPKKQTESQQVISLPLKADIFVELNKLDRQEEVLQTVVEQQVQPVTREVGEAFLVYLKVSLVAGFVLSSPWTFYQVWLFVAAGLYPTERRYVYYYLPFSFGLFLTGILFCFFLVLPFVLSFLLSFNKAMGVTPQIFLREWISFAIMLPVMFGLSFQLPVVMLFLERMSICSVALYREKRRMAILVIAVVSMLMTPSDPQSMILMMIPLLFLYELGIKICEFRVNKSTEPETI